MRKLTGLIALAIAIGLVFGADAAQGKKIKAPGAAAPKGAVDRKLPSKTED